MTPRFDSTFTDPDGFYSALVRANENLSDENSQAFTLRLVLLLANQIGDEAILDACIQEATITCKGDTENG